ncbi:MULTISPECIES: succinate dehydrogenase, hydrophobic membrane anchor protein [Ralstonia]|jgi:succinate dehydrogenase / fumarate reductase membrane anchor subunit|uniref:Succinate dehydrogenase hydrophobic membrane anchor subunit n=1 Tax=Ralstonia mannitolilytica TaxID=105219 RepID=A0A0D5ASM1_9RALS|nr:MULTISPECIES: succinate dehydrogenase, hydrophobic membrane anchor protein [Ralstonia]ATG19548.1 succinate dehydrogenase, hydrophobic membrane anchor protein [Ralstonia pickettii]AJW45643.1 succinate dehydrogenase [Ralstonia mannitolilytica]ANA32316.1 succinate dehydrogenase [Ralstonia mannitolilytica]MBU9581036.1 succinate dehydrogenase, hydrophobic membrane anchor protein [Ralstonia mannitolilytica]MBY4719061.1 succinate dehydrogenase, hydrophobic membrane anchor protein [Ralstonia mannit
MANNNIGPKRLVVGAHYGLKDFLAQRVTAVIMAVYTIVLLAAFLLSKDTSYQSWAGLFANQWMKLLTFLALLSLAYHAWIGVRDIWMDYVKPVAVRLTLQVLTILWLVGCAGYAAQILWRV